MMPGRRSGDPSHGQAPLALDADHPSFEGHFPGRPILPGVVLLAEALAVLESALSHPLEGWTIANAKFPSPAAPGEPLIMEYRVTDSGVAWDIRAQGRLVATGVLAKRDDADAIR